MIIKGPNHSLDNELWVSDTATDAQSKLFWNIPICPPH